MTPPKRTSEDARYHPVPGDKFVYTDGVAWTVTKVLGREVHFRTDEFSTDWCELRTWALDDGLGTWVPA